MKLLLLLVSVISVQTVHGRDFFGEYGGVDLVTETDPEATLSIDGPNSENEAQEFSSIQTDHIISRKGEPGCKALDICIIMGGSCVTNTSCEGKLVPGCKGKNCQCCVPGTMETEINSIKEKIQTMQINNLEEKLKNMQTNLTNTNSKLNTVLQTLKDVINDGNSKISTELKTLKDNLKDSSTKLNEELQNMQANLTNANSNQNMELQTLKHNLTDVNSNLNKELQTLEDNLTKELNSMSDNFKDSISKLTRSGCPEGFFQAPGSCQCYKLFKDANRNWYDAKKKCESDGLKLAEPSNPLGLRKYMVETYVPSSGHVYLHIGARGTGSDYKFEHSGRQISKTSSLWWVGHPGGSISTSHSICLLVNKGNMDSRPIAPYYANHCNTGRYTLCEL